MTQKSNYTKLHFPGEEEKRERLPNGNEQRSDGAVSKLCKYGTNILLGLILIGLIVLIVLIIMVAKPSQVYNKKTSGILIGFANFPASFANVPASNTEDGKHLIFATHDQDLPWPITSGLDVGQLIPHGPHCLAIIQKFTNGTKNYVDEFHVEHCRRLAIRALNHFGKNPNYFVPKEICEDLRTLYGSMRSMHGKSGGEFYGYLQYGYCNFHNLQKSADGISQARQIYDALAKQRVTDSQTELMSFIMGQNLGDVLMKEWRNETLTAAEAEVVRQWESQETVRMAALGIYCLVGNGTAPINELKQLVGEDSITCTCHYRCDKTCFDEGCSCYLKNQGKEKFVPKP